MRHTFFPSRWRMTWATPAAVVCAIQWRRPHAQEPRAAAHETHRRATLKHGATVTQASGRTESTGLSARQP